MIPPELAYGDMGTATIPAGATLTFTVRLHAAESFRADALFRIPFAAVPSNFRLLFGSRDPLAPDDTIISDPDLATSYWIQTFGGADAIEAGGFSDVVYAGEGDDSMDGGAGDDVFVAGGGNDRITGGLGSFDTAVYEGDFAQYNLTVVAPAVVDPAPAASLISVEDTLIGRDGADLIDEVEWLIFRDRYVKVSIVDGAVVVLDTILLTLPVADPVPAAAAPVPGSSSSPVESAPAPADADLAEDMLAPAASEAVDSFAADPLISQALVKLPQGRSVQRCTDDLDRLVYTKQSLDRKVDRIFGFDATQDLIVFKGRRWAKKLGASLVNVTSQQELKIAQYSTAAFVHHEGSGSLYWNANGDKEGWGKGGKFARLDAGLDMNPSNLSIL
jgi:Ca2+-binding RTX toxin-like protein